MFFNQYFVNFFLHPLLDLLLDETYVLYFSLFLIYGFTYFHFLSSQNDQHRREFLVKQYLESFVIIFVFSVSIVSIFAIFMSGYLEASM